MSYAFYKLVNYLIKRKYEVSINKHVFFIELFIEMYSLIDKNLFFMLFFTILLLQSITDFINNDVYTILNISIIIIGLIFKNINYNEILLSMLLPLLLWIINIFKKGIGDGDIEMIFALCFIYNTMQLSKIILFSSIMNLIYSFVIKKDKYSFIPFIFLSCLLLELFNA